MISVNTLVNEFEKANPMIVGHEDEPAYRCAILLFAVLELGNSIDRLSEFTGYSKEFVREVYERMQEAELWVEELVRCDHWKLKGRIPSFDVEFWMDVLVAHGSWIRGLCGNGEYSYFQIGPEP